MEKPWQESRHGEEEEEEESPRRSSMPMLARPAVNGALSQPLPQRSALQATEPMGRYDPSADAEGWGQGRWRGSRAAKGL
mmetsp:Transcript_75499/g.221376  ORF Transcript_75499/g.221376 Transcript_75499/m.221376 type:complete len:80 (+) Transcript_75499:1028-1267(+)